MHKYKHNITLNVITTQIQSQIKIHIKKQGVCHFSIGRGGSIFYYRKLYHGLQQWHSHAVTPLFDVQVASMRPEELIQLCMITYFYHNNTPSPIIVQLSIRECHIVFARRFYGPV